MGECDSITFGDILRLNDCKHVHTSYDPRAYRVIIYIYIFDNLMSVRAAAVGVVLIVLINLPFIVLVDRSRKHVERHHTLRNSRYGLCCTIQIEISLGKEKKTK